MIHVEVRGIAQVQENFGQLAAKLRDAIFKKVIRRILIPLRDAAKANLTGHNRTGALSLSMDLKVTSKGSKGMSIYGACGPRANVRVPVKVTAHGKHSGLLLVAIPTRYAHLVEFGHDVVVHGEIVGHVGPLAYMRRAWNTDGGAKLLERFIEELHTELEALQFPQ